jgi:hypothetical protein
MRGKRIGAEHQLANGQTKRIAVFFSSRDSPCSEML